MKRAGNTEQKNGSYNTADIDECLLCSGLSSSRIVAENSAFGKTFNVALCDECELYYFAKQPSLNFLDNFYTKKYFSKLEKKRVTYLLKSRFSKMRASSQYTYIQNYVGTVEGKSILEIGSADGTFLSLFKKNGCNIKGLELNDYMIKKAREKHNIVLEKTHILDIEPDKKSFDVIALSHALEHMPDPVRILTHCKKLLKPGGFIFIELPYSPHPGETTSEQLSEYLDTTHLFNFRRDSITNLIKKSGLNLISIDRFFYTVPSVFNKSSEFIGKTLMTGQLYSINPLKLLAVLISVLQMNINFISKSDPMKKIHLQAQWQGLGDNLRIIAG